MRRPQGVRTNAGLAGRESADMKMSMEWHRQCLKIQKAGLEREEAELARVAANVERYRSSVLAYERQIQDAADKNKDGFDSDRFGRKVARAD